MATLPFRGIKGVLFSILCYLFSVLYPFRGIVRREVKHFFVPHLIYMVKKEILCTLAAYYDLPRRRNAPARQMVHTKHNPNCTAVGFNLANTENSADLIKFCIGGRNFTPGGSTITPGRSSFCDEHAEIRAVLAEFKREEIENKSRLNFRLFAIKFPFVRD